MIIYFDPKKLPKFVKKTFADEEKKIELNKLNESDCSIKEEEIEIDKMKIQNLICTSLKTRLYQKNPLLMNNVFAQIL